MSGNIDIGPAIGEIIGIVALVFIVVGAALALGAPLSLIFTLVGLTLGLVGAYEMSP